MNLVHCSPLLSTRSPLPPPARARARAPEESSLPQAPVARALAALGLPSDEDAARPPFRWHRLRDVLSCMLAEWPARRPEGLGDAIWEVIQRRVSVGLALVLVL